MLEKELVKDEFKSDLGFNGTKKEPDPRVKMQMRHQQVYECWCLKTSIYLNCEFFYILFMVVMHSYAAVIYIAFSCIFIFTFLIHFIANKDLFLVHVDKTHKECHD